MRQTAARRAAQQEARENRLDRQLEAGLRRPASAGASCSSRRAEAETVTSEVTRTNPGLGGYPEPANVPIGDFKAFVNSGMCRSAGATCNSNPLPRRPFTSIPGYGGYVPRKVPNSIMGCTYGRGNVLS